MDYTRQRDIFNPANIDDFKIYIVGCGGIGSFVSMYLAQMGITDITLFDPDTAEEHNIPNQNFDSTQIGTPKVVACSDNIERRTGIEVDYHQTKFLGRNEHRYYDIPDMIILATDNITSRKAIFQWCLKNGVRYIVDGRLGGQHYQVFSVDLQDEGQGKEYETYFFDPHEQEFTPCTAKAIIYVALYITAEIVYRVKRFIMGQKNPLIVTHDTEGCTRSIDDIIAEC